MEVDDRLKKELDAGRTPRAQTDRLAQERVVAENRELTEDDRLALFRNSLFNDALPDLPPIDGYHVCWLTTDNPRDPIHRRLQLGYELIKAAEVPGFAYASIKTGDYEGFIGVNEMIAAKLPMTLYLAFMNEVHHSAPARDDARLTDLVDQARDDAERVGAKLVEGDGLKDLRRSAPAHGIFE